MAELSYPAPGVTQVQHERLMGGASASGVAGFPTDDPVVYAPNSGTREIRVRADRRAVVEGYGWETDASELVRNLAANVSGSTRVDLVVLRLDRATWDVTVEVVQGTPGSGAPAPTYGTGSSGVWELPLAEVAVASGATTLAGSTVTNRAWYVGPDGQIRCTTSTLPPHEAGRAVWVHPDGRWMVSTGGQWLTGVEDTGAVAASMVSGYTSSHNTLWRRNGLVFYQLTLQRTAQMAANTAYKVATSPAGYRPAVQVQTAAVISSTGATAVAVVQTDGDIYINPGGTTIPANTNIVLAAGCWPAAA